MTVYPVGMERASVNKQQKKTISTAQSYVGSWTNSLLFGQKFKKLSVEAIKSVQKCVT